jgi:hypothetical protein
MFTKPRCHSAGIFFDPSTWLGLKKDSSRAPADTLDLDFYVTLNPDNEPAVSKVVIHKVNGKSRW